MASFWTVHIGSSSFIPVRGLSEEFQFRSELRTACNCVTWKWNQRVAYRKFVAKAMESDDDRRLQNDVIVLEKLEKSNDEKPKVQNAVAKLQESIGSLPKHVFSIQKISGMNLTVGLCIIATMLVVVVRSYATKRSTESRPGSVADLVRRGQLRSDRRGISTPLKYEDPFNNPMIKVSKNNSTVEMCGKIYRLAPVALTDEIQTVHQKRRSRAYQWKRPTIFLKEGEAIPPDVDPDTVRWIPANHPFATTSSDIDEDLAQNNVYQKHGVPFRIQAEHEALQKKLEALQNDQKLSKLVIDPAAAREFERPFKKSQTKQENHVEQSTSNPPPCDQITNNSIANKPPFEETTNP